MYGLRVPYIGRPCDWRNGLGRAGLGYLRGGFPRYQPRLEEIDITFIIMYINHVSDHYSGHYI